MTNSNQDYEMCFRVENIDLPKGGYFGVSAATGMNLVKKKYRLCNCVNKTDCINAIDWLILNSTIKNHAFHLCIYNVLHKQNH